MQIHPEGDDDLKPFPAVNPQKQYRVWRWYCGDSWCECWYIYVMEADDFITEQRTGYISTSAVNGKEVWRGTWTSGDDGDQWAILEAEEKAATEHFGDKES